MDTEQVEHQARRALGAWSATSATAGVGLWLVGRWVGQPVVRTVGVQSLLWGANNGALAALGSVTSGVALPAAQVRSARWANVAVDLVVITSGAVLVARPRSAPRWLSWPDRSSHPRGHGLALLVQGVAMLAIDAWAVRHLRVISATRAALSAPAE